MSANSDQETQSEASPSVTHPERQESNKPAKLWNLEKESLSLLPKHDKLMLVFSFFCQVLTSLLDLAGVLLLGLTAALATSSLVGGAPIASSSLLAKVGFTGSVPAKTVVLIALLAGIALVSKSLLSFLITRKTFRFLASRQAAISGNLVRQLFSTSLPVLQTRSSQETALSLAAGVTSIVLGILGQGIVIAAEFTLISALSVGLFVIDPVVAIFSIIFFGCLAWILVRRVSSMARRLGRLAFESEVSSLESVQEGLGTFRELFVSGRREVFARKFESTRVVASEALADTYIMSQLGKYVFEIGLVIGGGLLVGFMLVSRSTEAAVATITVFLVAASRIVPSLLRIQSAVVIIHSNQGTADATFELISEVEPLIATASAEGRSGIDVNEYRLGFDFVHEGFTPKTEIRDLEFFYPNSAKPTLSDVSFTVEEGRSLAIVGSTGAGKSTLVDLILGAVRPASGFVTISGLEPEIAIATWPGAIGYVPQSTAIVAGTIRENVALGLPRNLVDDSLVWEALDRAQLRDFLRDVREGLDTTVGEHGMRLSGGQRQRLGLARALYSKPKLLVLDEATSALDAETERLVSEMLSDLKDSCTLIVIAHRLSTVRDCDALVYLDEGRVRMIGTFDEVRSGVKEFDQQARLLGIQ